jgi:hypothetical protein
MTTAETRVYELRRMETMLTSFIARTIGKKEERLSVLEGINELDDIARTLLEGSINSAKERKLAEWVESHEAWKESESVRPGDRYRVRMILSEVKNKVANPHLFDNMGPTVRDKMLAWLESNPPTEKSVQPQSMPPKLVLKRASESAIRSEIRPKMSEEKDDHDTLANFEAHLAALSNLHKDLSGNRLHLISVLDEALSKAERQFHREALHLAAAIIYYLKLQGYLVEPFVTRLKTAERVMKSRDEQQKSGRSSEASHATT